jgi:toxin ParE1/3/4
MTPSPQVHLREQAVTDLDDIGDQLAERSADLALRFAAAVQETLRFLLRFPLIGSPRDFANSELAGMRQRVVRNFRHYLIFYIPVEDGIEVVRVLHSSRDLDAQFAPSDEP